MLSDCQRATRPSRCLGTAVGRDITDRGCSAHCPSRWPGCPTTTRSPGYGTGCLRGAPVASSSRHAEARQAKVFTKDEGRDGSPSTPRGYRSCFGRRGATEQETRIAGDEVGAGGQLRVRSPDDHPINLLPISYAAHAACSPVAKRSVANFGSGFGRPVVSPLHSCENNTFICSAKAPSSAAFNSGRL
jgi:hypothetical protein